MNLNGWLIKSSAALMLLLNCPNNAQTILKAYKISHHHSIPQAKNKNNSTAAALSLSSLVLVLSHSLSLPHLSALQCFASKFK